MLLLKKRNEGVEIYDLSKADRIVVTKNLIFLEMESGKSFVIPYYDKSKEKKLSAEQFKALLKALIGKNRNAVLSLDDIIKVDDK